MLKNVTDFSFKKKKWANNYTAMKINFKKWAEELNKYIT